MVPKGARQVAASYSCLGGHLRKSERVKSRESLTDLKCDFRLVRYFIAMLQAVVHDGFVCAETQLAKCCLGFQFSMSCGQEQLGGGDVVVEYPTQCGCPIDEPAHNPNVYTVPVQHLLRADFEAVSCECEHLIAY